MSLVSQILEQHTDIIQKEENLGELKEHIEYKNTSKKLKEIKSLRKRLHIINELEDEFLRNWYLKINLSDERIWIIVFQDKLANIYPYCKDKMGPYLVKYWESDFKLPSKYLYDKQTKRVIEECIIYWEKIPEIERFCDFKKVRNVAEFYGCLNVIKYFFEKKRIEPSVFDVERATKYGHLHLIKYFLEEKRSPYYQNVFITASARGYLHILEYILEKYQNAMNSFEIYISIINVLKNNQLHLFDYLLEKAKDYYYTFPEIFEYGHHHLFLKFEENKISHQTWLNAVSILIKKQEFELVNKFITKVNKNKHSYDILLEKACKSSSWEMITHLIENYFKPILNTTYDNFLRILVYRGDLIIFENFIEKYKDNIKDINGIAHYAHYERKTKILEYLVENYKENIKNPEKLLNKEQKKSRHIRVKLS